MHPLLSHGFTRTIRSSIHTQHLSAGTIFPRFPPSRTYWHLSLQGWRTYLNAEPSQKEASSEVLTAMNMAKLRSFCCKSEGESGAALQYGDFRRAHSSMMFVADTSTLMRWCRWECKNIGITSLCSKERPDLPRPFRIQRQGCYGGGAGIPASDSERTGPQVATESLGAATDCLSSYKVKEGDTLTSIAIKFKVTVKSIALANKIADIDYVHAGKLLLIPFEYMKSGEVIAKADGLPTLVESEDSENKGVVIQTESSLSVVPPLAPPFSFQTWHVRLALCLVILLAISSFVKRYISDLRTRKHDEVLRYQVEKEVQDSCHQPKLRRWQGILDDDRMIDEADGDLLADGRIVMDVEEEKLRQSYAQLESVYVKFLADSGLSKSGYWRGGVPPAVEDK